jgi:hypothetical protein
MRTPPSSRLFSLGATAKNPHRGKHMKKPYSHREPRALTRHGEMSIGSLPASQNARVHGLFARELVLSPEEATEFRRLERDLRRELAPNSELLEIVFGDVVACAWRMKLALRLEQHQVRRELEAESQELAAEAVDDDSPLKYPFPLRKRELSQRLKFLEELREMIQIGSLRSDEWKGPITEAFGEEFWMTLAEWEPQNLIYAQLAYCAAIKTESFPPSLIDELNLPGKEQTQKWLDPLPRQEMQLKLLDLKRQHLLEALHFAEESRDGQAVTQGTAGPLDLYLRYRTQARRDFYRALKDYRELKADLMRAGRK